MRKLLSAGISRLWKNKVFWVCMALMAVSMFGSVISSYMDSVTFQIMTPIDSVLSAGFVLAALCAAVFCGLFIGTEYSDGTIRNKLIVGQRREAVYLSGLCVVVLAAFLMMLVYLVPCGILGGLLLGRPVHSVGEIVGYLAISFLNLVVWAALYHMFAMLLGKKSAAVVACMLAYLVLVIGGEVVVSMLDQPPFITDYVITANGVDMSEPIPNPYYLAPGSTKRTVYEFLYDLLPGGQVFQLTAMAAERPARLVLCALGEIAGFTGLGLALFKRKDLK